MKTIKTLTVFFVILFFSFTSYAAQITFSIQPGDNSGYASGFRIYQRIDDQAYNYSSPLIIGGVTDENGNMSSEQNQFSIEINPEPYRITVYRWVARSFLNNESGDPIEESVDSIEVEHTEDRTAPDSVTSLEATFEKENGVIILNWEQPNPDKVSYWKIFASLDSGGPYTEIGHVENSGQADVFLTADMDLVGAGERADVYFTVVSFRDSEVFSQNSEEITINIDRRELKPPVIEIIVTIPVAAIDSGSYTTVITRGANIGGGHYLGGN